MPNWTTNIITLKNADADKINALIQAHNSEDTGVLQHLIPCPAELNDNDLTTWSHGPEQTAREIKQAAMIEKYGFKSWYDWNIAHWGTKWDLCESDITRVDDNTVTISCQTAWSPPTTAFETLQAQGWEVRALYVGEGMEYAGIWDNGDDDYYNTTNGSKAAQAAIPQELDDAFDIVSTLEEYERENEEELTLWIKDGVEERKEAKVSEQDL
jgi:hypothetical protein